MDSKDLYKALWKRFSTYKGYKYQLENVYLFDWESDFLCRSGSGYTYEIEVKTSYSDFKADFNKEDKHKVLAAERITGNGSIPLGSSIKIIYPNKCRPHKFIFAAPEGIIPPEEVPEYAGLLELSHTLKYTIRPPFLHKEPLDINNALLEKYYYKYLSLR